MFKIIIVRKKEKEKFDKMIQIFKDKLADLQVSHDFIESQALTIKNLEIENGALETKLLSSEKNYKKILASNGGYKTSNKKLKNEIDKMKSQLEFYEAAKINLESKLKELENNKKELSSENCKLKKDSDDQIKMIVNLNAEIKKVKARKKAPTIDELEKDKLFHGRRNKK